MIAQRIGSDMIPTMRQVNMDDIPEPPAEDLRGELLNAMRGAIREATANNATLAKGAHARFIDPTEAALDAALERLGLDIA